MHVAHVGFHLDPQRRDPRELLRDWPSLVDIAESAARHVDRVSVVQACGEVQCIAHNGVDYHFTAAAKSGVFSAGGQPHFGPVIDRVRELQPDVVHVHGLDFSGAVVALARRLPTTPILLQDHASQVPRMWRRWQWRRGVRCASGIAICAHDQLAPYRRARLLAADIQVFEIPESTSRFGVADSDQARKATGITGDPAVLWIGRLDENKDPLAVLNAVRRLAPALPRLELWCAYGSTELLAEIRRQLSADPILDSRVHLLGTVAHSQVELLMNAADLYVSASHREGSGYALIEALACGLWPVVSDIPSFRALTAAGTIGELWSHDNPSKLDAALIRAAALPRPTRRALARAHFERELSFEAIGKRLAAAYGLILSSAPRRQT